MEANLILDYDYIDDEFVIFKSPSQAPIKAFPTRLDVGVIGICLDGKALLEINLKSYTLEKNCIIFMRPGDIVYGREADESFSALFIGVSFMYLQGVTSPLPIQMPLMLHLKEYPMIKVADEEMACLLDYYEFIWRQVKNESNQLRKETVRCLMRALVIQLWSILSIHFSLQSDDRKDRKHELTEQFFQKLQQTYKEERSVNFYADALCVTPKHLSTVVKLVTGRTTSDWIDDYVILEAKASLKNSSQSVQQIAIDLHFSDQSFFAKFFKKHTGVSPTEYRVSG